jgi:hypothetical protein
LETPLRAFWLLIVLSLALALPATVAAQTPTDDNYDPVDIRTEARASDSGSGDKLPYTGGDIALVVLAGAAVLGTGFAIRRASRT